jgi:hypothetical protein
MNNKEWSANPDQKSHPSSSSLRPERGRGCKSRRMGNLTKGDNMKATLAFTLPEEREEFKDATEGSRWKGVAYDLDTWLRNEIKYQESKQVASQELLQKIRDQLYRYLMDAEVSFD